MAFRDKIVTSLFGRRFGLQVHTTPESGGSKGNIDYLVGPEAIRSGVTTAESTGTNAAAYGISFFPGTSAASSAVYTLDPPVPGVEKTLVFNSTTQGPIYVKTANGETILSTQGTTFSVIKSTNNTVAAIKLYGLTTAIWGMAPGLSTASFALSTTT